jgi:uncharacterized membrane protein YfcA
MAVMVGAVIGAVGSGSIITLPVLVYILRLPVAVAVGISVVVAGATSFGAAIWYYRRGFVDLRIALMLAASGVPGSLAGAALTHLVPAAVVMVAFSGLLLIAGATMLRAPKQNRRRIGCQPALCVATGAAVGFATGFLGVGGGFLIIPTLVLLGGLETSVAVGTALTVITLNSIAGFAGHLHFAALDWKLALAFMGLSIAGMGLGVSIAARLPTGGRRRLFGWMTTIVGIAVACENALKLI